MDKNRLIVAALAVVGLLMIFRPPATPHEERAAFGDARPGVSVSTDFPVTLSYSELLSKAKERKIDAVLITGRTARGRLLDGPVFSVALPDDARVSDQLAQMGVDVRVAQPPEPGPLGMIFASWVPMLLMIGVWVYFMRQMNGGGKGGGAFSFGKSKARLHAPDAQGRVTFDDVAGIEEAKADLLEVVDFLKNPQKFQRLGGKIPKGVLLVGPPGTGKTLIARAVAGEANVPFFSISGSDFVEMFVGVGASRVRDMFETARKNAPCIIFIDEIDAMGRHRGAGIGGGNDEREQTLNQMLVEMDGFAPNEGIILIAATNRPDVLDPALLRPGRFDRQVVVGNPDLLGREKILKVHLRKLPLAGDVDAKIVARGTPGFSGADLANLCNEAALLAARRDKRVVAMAEFEAAKDKIMMGAERRTLAMSDDEKRLTAYHEAGHALCAVHEPASDPVHKATIVPRGRALGMVMRLPQNDRVSLSLEKLEADLTVAMGGRVAEELVFGGRKVTTGASGDIQMATSMARRMVTEWGFSDKLGTIRYVDNQEEVFLGHSVARQQNMSDDTARLIDQEVRRIVDDGHDRARRILTEHLGALHRLAQALIERETLTGDDIGRIARGEELPAIEAVGEAVETPAPARPRGSVPGTGPAAAVTRSPLE